MKVLFIVAGVVVALVLLGWLGLQIRPRALLTFAVLYGLLGCITVRVVP